MAFHFDVVRFNYRAMAELVALTPVLRRAKENDLAELNVDAMAWDYYGPLSRFHDLVYESGLMDPCPGRDYHESSDLAKRCLDNPALVANVKAGPLRQVLMYIVRGDRFCSGFLLSAWRKGALVAILERLAKVHARNLANPH